MAREEYPRNLSSEGTLGDMLLGRWTYRSFHNRPAFVGSDPKLALDLIFAEATIEVRSMTGDLLRAALIWDDEDQMLMSARVSVGQCGLPTVITSTAIGIPEKATAGWVYQHLAYVVPPWPGGIDQRPALVGTVTRTIPHGAAKAGYVASFVAVKQE